MKVLKTTMILFGILLGFSTHGQQNLNEGNIIHQLNDQLTEVIITDGFSPPEASRIYAYANIAAYETVVHTSKSGFISLGGQLNGFRGFADSSPTQLDDEYLLVFVYTEVAKELVYRSHLLDHFKHAYLNSRADLNPETKLATETFGTTWKNEFINWISQDGYHRIKEGQRYIPFTGPQFWEPTPPAYLSALIPNWMKLRPLILDSITEIVTSAPLPFDTVPTSAFYKEAFEVYDKVNNLKSGEREIALFWDCNPLQTKVIGHFNFASRQLNPAGHWVSIVKIVCKDRDLNLQECTQLYALTCIGMFDGFILAWQEKYRSSLIRPETYINRYIDSEWQPLLETPPFPEHPSAHSVISTAASVILTDILGDNVAFTDDTEETFGLTIRKFNSFKEAANEAAFSRLPGGIHYRTGIKAGIETGRKLGILVLDKVKTKSE